MSVRSGRIDPTTTNAGRGPTALTIAGAAIEPIATPPIARPQKMPRTRVRVSSGTERWSRVKSATSSTLLAAPTIASRNAAAAK